MGNINELVFKGENGKVLTTSLKVAETFGKEHKNVLKDIRELKSSEEFNQLNFELVDYTDSKGEKRPMYVMTRDGFTILVMGYTGKKAMGFKEKYIAAFNEMEKIIKEGTVKKHLSPSELFAMQVQVNLDFENRVSSVESKVAQIEQRHEEATKKLLALPLSEQTPPTKSLRSKINELARNYATASGLSYQDVWHKVYKELYYTYHISINSYHKLNPKECKLDVAERNGLLDKVYTIISNLIRVREEC